MRVIAPYTEHVVVSFETDNMPELERGFQKARMGDWAGAYENADRLAAPGLVRLEIYNTLGQPVRTLVDQFQAAGAYQVPWDAHDGQGAAVSSGVYLTRLHYPGGEQTRLLLYLK